MNWAEELKELADKFDYSMDLTLLYNALKRAAEQGYKRATLSGPQMLNYVGVEDTMKNRRIIVRKLEAEGIGVAHSVGDQREPADEYTFSWDI